MNNNQGKNSFGTEKGVYSNIFLETTHELKNILGTIKNITYYIRVFFKDKSDKKLQKYLELLDKEVEGANRLIINTILYHRLPLPNYQKVSLNTLIKEFFTNKFNVPSNIRLIMDLDKSNPHLKIDPIQIEEVILNISKNSIEAMPKGGTLKITTSQENGYVCIEIRDTGKGLSKSLLNKIMSRTLTNSQKFYGLSLGLVVCYNIINAHRGVIEIDSKYRKGTVVRIKLRADNG